MRELEASSSPPCEGSARLTSMPASSRSPHGQEDELRLTHTASRAANPHEAMQLMMQRRRASRLTPRAPLLLACLALWLTWGVAVLCLLRPLRLQLCSSIQTIDEHTMAMAARTAATQQLHARTLAELTPAVSSTEPRSSASSHIGQSSAIRSYWLSFPVAQAAELPASASKSFPASHAESADATEFDAFSAEQLASQFIVIYRDDVASSAGFLSLRNLTQSILAEHRKYLRLVAEFNALPGFACVADVPRLLSSSALAYSSDATLRQDSDSRSTAALEWLLTSLRSHPSVLLVSPDQPLSSAGAALRAGATVPPGVRRVQAASQSTVGAAASVSVAVLDTGIDLRHPALNARNGINCISRVELMRSRRRQADDDENESDGVSENNASSTNGEEEEPANDDNAHGTHVAGIIGGQNRPGSVVGVAPGTTLYAVKILNSSGQGSWAHLLCGINWVMENAQQHNIKLASMSLAGFGANDNACGERNSDALHKAICQATKAGILVVAAAGNNAADLAGIVPASYPEVLTVTAMADSDGLPGAMGPPLTCRGYENDDHAASFSNYALLPLSHPASSLPPQFNVSGDQNPAWAFSPLLSPQSHGSIVSHVISAPGACIESTVVRGGFGYFSGTSQACPHVTGILALMYGVEGGDSGPCHHASPHECMRLLMDRSHRMAAEAQMAYEFLPWQTERATRPGSRAGTDETFVVQVTQEDMTTLREVKGEEVPMGAIRMRKYFGPMVVGHMP